MIKKKAVLWGIAIWIVATIIFSMFDAPSDGFTSIGFPWHFYSYNYGNSTLVSGFAIKFSFTDFLLDLIALLAFIILFSIILSNRQKQPK